MPWGRSCQAQCSRVPPDFDSSVTRPTMSIPGSRDTEPTRIGAAYSVYSNTIGTDRRPAVSTRNRVPRPIGPGVICSALRSRGFHRGSCRSSPTTANTSSTGRAISISPATSGRSCRPTPRASERSASRRITSLEEPTTRQWRRNRRRLWGSASCIRVPARSRVGVRPSLGPARTWCLGTGNGPRHPQEVGDEQRQPAEQQQTVRCVTPPQPRACDLAAKADGAGRHAQPT